MTDKEFDTEVNRIAKAHYNKDLSIEELLYVAESILTGLQHDLSFYTEFDLHADIHEAIEEIEENGLPLSEHQEAVNEYWNRIVVAEA